MTAQSHAFVESPLQFLSCLEAHEPGEQLVIHARKKATGMAGFLKQLPPELIPEGVVIDKTKPDPTALQGITGRILIGDPFSGKFQKPLAMAAGRIRSQFVLLDDGYATVRAVRLLSSPDRQSLVRTKGRVKVYRRVLGHTTAMILRHAMNAGRLEWVTALPVDQELADAFTAAGGRMRRHSFERLRNTEVSDPELNRAAHSKNFVLGTALASDGLIDPERYIEWVRRVSAQCSEDDPCIYYAHRRQSAKLLRRLEQIPGLEVRPAGLPVELRLARAPYGAHISSLPTSALTTLPLIMDSPVLDVTPVPQEWWTGTGSDKLRRELNDLALAAQKRTKLPPATPDERVRIVAVSDSESYLKWAASTLDSLGPEFKCQIWLVASPIKPTSEQVANAVAGTSWQDKKIPLVNRSQLGREFRLARPDIVLAAATGPVVQQIFASAATLSRRPGLVSGLPGVGLPARSKGMRYRQLADMFIAHSEHERRAYEEVAAKVGVPLEVVVARLPMLRSELPPLPRAPQAVRTLVFAPQAKVPASAAQRQAVLLSLADFARGHLEARVILKVRSRPGEHETHREEFTYVSLLEGLVAEGLIGEDELAVEVGPMSRFLQDGSALVTVSSTAALESIDRGLPTLIISDFGVDDDMLNGVFAESGVLGTLADMIAGRIGFPTEEWLAENYFQPPSTELRDSLMLLARRSRERQLSDLRWAARVQDYRRLRAELRTLAPEPVVTAYRRVRYARTQAI